MAKKSKAKPQRFRLRFPFWLDLNKQDEADLADKIEHLKNERSFTKTIRDGIRLICDLRAGQVDVLFELFPWVKDKLVEHTTSSPTTAIEAQLQRLEAMLTEQGAVAIDRPGISMGGPKPLPVAKVSLPTFDDDYNQDTVIIRKATNTDAATNLVNSMLGLQA
jgi:hypothetical protein